MSSPPAWAMRSARPLQPRTGKSGLAELDARMSRLGGSIDRADKTFMSRTGLLCALIVAATVVAFAQEVRRINVSKLGPQVGATVPDFTLADQHGKKRTLQSVMGPKGAMIVFYRSADWCPYCKTQLLELQSQYDTLRKDGLGLAGISYDSQEILAAFSQQHGITFPLLSDVGSETIKRYGILNTVPGEGLGANRTGADLS